MAVRQAGKRADLVAGASAGRRAGRAPVVEPETRTDDAALDDGGEERPATLREASQMADDAETELLSMFGDLTDGADALIFRATDGGKFAYVGTVDAGLLSYEHIAKTFGPGRYSVRPRVPRASDGRKQFAGERKVEIDAAYARRASHAAVGVESESVSFDKVMSAGVLSMFQQMQAMNASTLELVRAAAKEPPPPPDLVGPIVAIVGAVSPIITAYLAGGKREGAADVMKLVREARDLVTPPRAPTPLAEMVQTMEAVQKLRELGGGDGGDRPGIGERLVESLAPLLMQGAMQARPAAPVATATVAAAPVAASPAVASAPAAPALPPQEVTPMMAMLAHLGKWIAPLLRWAQENRDPTTYAGLFYDEMPVGLRGAALELVRRPNVVTEIVAQRPEFAGHEQWISEWIEELTALLDPKPDE
jgi:hypothetical protein